jgi:hypothetical protein
MLEKLATHDVQDVSALFSLVDKCTKAMEGRAWHSLAAQVAKGESKTSAGAQGGGSSNKKKKKKKASGNRPLAGVPTVTAAAAGGVVADREVTNAPVIHPTMMTAARSARCTTPRVIPRRSAGRSRSSRKNSTKRYSNSIKMVHHSTSGRASRRWTPRRRKT